MMTITDKETQVFRAALYPRFQNDSGQFSPQLVVSDWGPVKTPSGRRALGLSIGLGSMLADNASVHHFGCRTADAANAYLEKKAETNGIEHEPVFYRGSYTLAVDEVLLMDIPGFDVFINHVPEPGRDEHGHVEVHAQGEMSGSQLVKNRVKAIAEIYLLLRSPSEHICPDVDPETRTLLEEVRLVDVQTLVQSAVLGTPTID